MMRARGLSHVGVTVADFGRAVRFYWEVFGCPLIAVSEMPPERVRAFFGITDPSPTCTVGWILLPDGGVLELFAFEPKEPKAALQWNRPGFTHVALHVNDLDRWHAHLTVHGVQCLSKPIKTPAGHRLFYAKDTDGNLIELIDLGYRYHLLVWIGGIMSRFSRLRRFGRYYQSPPSPP